MRSSYSSSNRPLWVRLWPRLYRLILLAAMAWLVHCASLPPRPPKVEGVSGSTLTSLAMAEAIERRLGGPVTSLRFPDPATLAEVQSLFPTAAQFQSDDPRGGWLRVLDKRSTLLGFAVRTSPYT